jgi:multidrug efflux pump
MLGGREVTRFKRNGEQYDVVVQIADENRMDPTDLKSIFVRSAGGEMVQLSNIVSLPETVAPRELNHFNKLRSATITANLAGDFTLGEALGFMEQSVRDISSTAQVDYDGVSREFKQSSSSIAFIFLLALGFIYLVLAAQFESFVDPLIILLSVPLAIAGALFTITVTGGTLNIYSQIGLIALIGLISKNGILIVEFANQLQEQGKSISDAIVESAALRLRPILMTTAATILGAIPLALSTGAGSESRQAIGWVIVGGMSFGTLMTLFVIPSFYLLLARKKG